MVSKKSKVNKKADNGVLPNKNGYDNQSVKKLIIIDDDNQSVKKPVIFDDYKKSVTKEVFQSEQKSSRNEENGEGGD